MAIILSSTEKADNCACHQLKDNWHIEGLNERTWLVDTLILISYLEVKMHLCTRWTYLCHFFILLYSLSLDMCERIMDVFWPMHLVHSLTKALINWASQQIYRHFCFSPSSMFLASHVVINVCIYQGDPHVVYKIMHICHIKIKYQCILKLNYMK